VVPVAIAWGVAVWLVGAPTAAPVTAAAAGAVGLAALAVLVAARAVRGPIVPGPIVPRRAGPGRAAAPPRRSQTVRAVARAVILSALAVMLLATAVGAAWPVRSPEPVRRLAGGAVSASVVADRDVAPDARSFAGTAQSVRRGTVRVDGLRVPVRVVLAARTAGADGGRTGGPGDGSVAAGSVLTVPAHLEREPPGSAAAFVLFTRAAPEVSSRPRGLLEGTDRIRRSFVVVAGRLPEPGAGLLRGLAIGDRTNVDETTADAMETTALTHLTAVSGSNCAVLVGLIMALGRVVRAPRTLRAGAAITVLAGFVLLVRPDPSIVRAALMAVVVLVIHVTGRPVRGAPLVALAAIGMLVADPWLARSYAFTLSVLATAGIVVVAPRLMAVAERWMPTPIAALLAVPVAAQLACWPVTVLLAPSIPVFAVPANLLAEPLAPVATVLGLAGCVLAPLWPTGAAVLAAGAWAPATGIALLARMFAGLPFATVPWPAGGPGAVAVTTVAGGLVVAVFLGGRRRASLVAAAGLVGVLAVGTVVVPTMAVRASLPAVWSIAACDVGQGDAVLIRQGSAVALVDTGDDEERLLACLDLLGIGQIDLFIASHYDRDHVGAVPAVAPRVDRALVGPLGRPEDQEVVDALTGAGAHVRRGMIGTSGTLGQLRWQVLWPSPDTTTGGNDASLVVRFEPGSGCADCLSSLFLGDLGESGQRRVMAAAGGGGALGRVDVVKVAHHGSADQSPSLYDAVDARVGIVSVGADNTYGHPTDAALRMLRDAGTAVVRTDRSGTVVLGGPPGAITVWTERSEAAPSHVAPTLERTDRASAGLVPTERNAWRSRSRRGQRQRSTRCPGPASGRRRWCS